MFVHVDGRIVEESAAHVPITDRGFLFGDAIFETLRSVRGQPLLWTQHFARWRRGAELLKIPLSVQAESLHESVTHLLSKNRTPDAVVRITLSRGSGPRGYSPKGALQPRLIITCEPAPEPFGAGRDWDLVLSTWRTPPPGSLTQVKHANRLVSVLARAEADAAGADDALQLGVDGQVAEASASNVAWFDGDTLVSPGFESGALPGVTLDCVMQIAARLGWRCRRESVVLERLFTVDGVFLTNSVHLLVGVRSLDGRRLRRSPKIKVLVHEIRNALLDEGARL